MHSTIAIDQAFQKAIEDKVFSGAAIIAGRGKQRLFEGYYGYHSWEENELEIGPRSFFDIASLTKVIATTSLIQYATEEKVFKLRQTLQELMPAFDRPEKITLQALLEHQSGLPDYLPLFESFKSAAAPYGMVRERFIQEINERRRNHEIQ